MLGENHKKKIFIILAIVFAVSGIVFSLLYYVSELFVPAATSASLGLMFIFLLLLVKESPCYLTQKQNVIFKLIAWIGLIFGVLTSVLQLIIYFHLL